MDNYSNSTPEERKATFCQLLTETKRPGIPKLLEWLENSTDFYTAPASTRYHLCCEGGLLIHSLNVYSRLVRLVSGEDWLVKGIGESQQHPERAIFKSTDTAMASIAIVALLHDVCKVNYYTKELKHRKVDGKWEDYYGYSVNDQFPYGHGEKSVFLIEHNKVDLSVIESMAIRWHMGPFGDESKLNTMSLNRAYEQNPFACLTFLADYMATQFDDPYCMPKKEEKS